MAALTTANTLRRAGAKAQDRAGSKSYANQRHQRHQHLALRGTARPRRHSIGSALRGRLSLSRGSELLGGVGDEPLLRDFALPSR
jgi:hypothetical protein